MAKILLIISALIIAATAYLGFATKQKVETIQGELAEKKKTLIATQGDLSKTKGTLKKTEDELVAAKATIDEKEKDIADKKGQIDKLTSDAAKATAELEESNKQLAQIKTAMDELEKNFAGIKPEELAGKIRDLSEAKTKLESRVAELTQVQETLNKQVMEEKSKSSAAELQVKGYKEEYMKPGVTGTVLAYNPGWNFLVLSIGDKQSVKVGKEMVVSRGGQMIAKVRVTSVEPSSSIADIIPSSVAKGESVQPGDSVIYETRTK